MVLNLIVLPGQFAVLKFLPSTRIPQWALQEEGFLSITRTEDELSIVCRQSFANKSNLEGAQVERDWSCFKVEGPLDFGLTGILASLANPLAESLISIFAISTYDTDYLLVKTEKLEEAIQVLATAGNRIRRPEGRPRDGPSTSFIPDPLVAPLAEKNRDFSTFGLVVVTGWPENAKTADFDLKSAYEKYIKACKDCFTETEDVAGDPACVYFYPYSSLHITVATFYSINQKPLTAEEQAALALQCTEIMEKASALPAWPTNPLCLRIERSQIGSRAGILLWKEETGGLEKMRLCIKNVCDRMKHGSTPLSLSIPPICHSTVLRFYKEPLTAGSRIQENFDANVAAKLDEFFPGTISCSVARLVCEKYPYMHIPDDAEHVLLSCYTEANTK